MTLATSPVTLREVKKNPLVDVYIHKANEHLGAMGYTEHGHRHAGLVSSISHNVMTRLGYSEREAELAAIAGYLHDLGNVVSRTHHAQIGALLAGRILGDMGMDPAELATIIGAIGNHEEEQGEPVSKISAAVILADKSDVHRTRVRNTDLATFDIHDRVSYAAVYSFLNVEPEIRAVTLEITIETEICPVMEYFEIFLTRMIMSRRAAELLDARFGLVINGAKLL
ncbi:MAG: HD domain-containing protein [Firmicutes bacterium]|nr:HD domain-containing protein [Bacillota bacterium]